MQVIINGESKTFAKTHTISSLIKELNLDPSKIAIEVNREIIPCSLHGKTCLNDNDILEIVNFVGGG